MGYSKDNREDRRPVIASAVASQRLAGLDLHPDDLAEFERFVEGDITIEQLRQIIHARTSSLQNRTNE